MGIPRGSRHFSLLMALLGSSLILVAAATSLGQNPPGQPGPPRPNNNCLPNQLQEPCQNHCKDSTPPPPTAQYCDNSAFPPKWCVSGTTRTCTPFSNIPCGFVRLCSTGAYVTDPESGDKFECPGSINSCIWST
jgi:hypothetical protein